MQNLSTLYARMALIRRFEEELLELANAGEIPGVIHPYTGHEAVAVGVLSGRDPNEWVISYYRCHGHAVASGSPIGPLMREMLDREGAVCGGKSGSMQFCDVKNRFLLASSIVASQLPIAAGVAFREMAERSGRAVVVFSGDGALGAGVAYETVMIARQKRLPLLLVCEDNKWQDRTVSSSVMPARPADLLRGLGVAVVETDGNDVEEVSSTARTALDDCRAGRGPVALVAHTYLRDFHSQLRSFSPRQYRSKDEVDQWRERDPLDLAERRLHEQGLDPSREWERATAVVREAVEQALAAPGTPLDRAQSAVTVTEWDPDVAKVITR